MAVRTRFAILHGDFTKSNHASFALEQLVSLLPYADVLPLVPLDDGFSDLVKSRVATAKIKSRFYSHRYYRAFGSLATRTFDCSSYDLVISNGTGSPKNIGQSDSMMYICYTHTFASRAQSTGAGELANDLAFSARSSSSTLTPSRVTDIGSFGYPDYLIANSGVVAATIKQSCGRNCYVIHPPVHFRREQQDVRKEGYALVISSLVSRRRIDMVIAACNAMRKPLLIVGDGPDRSRLEELAGPKTGFMGALPESDITDLIARCEVLVCVGAEDEFDPLPIKASAWGRPSASIRAGSALETIQDNETGILFGEWSRPSVEAAIERCAEQNWDRETLHSFAAEFGPLSFQRKFASLLEAVTGESTSRN
jgi:glycosyltransferase involved in cell wall biosynthesis